MKIQTARVLQSALKKNRDGETLVRMLQVELSDPDDKQWVELFTQSGEDYNPPNDSTVIVVEAGDAWKIAIATDDGIAPSVDQGERELYSIDATGLLKKVTIKLLKNGDLEIGNGIGTITMNGITGQVNINGNFTVDV
jgi:hypothetical protein